jgi:D-amino-acid dehydrogenase
VNSRPRTAVVIGNGVIGLTSAIALQKRGIDTVVVAPDLPWRGPSWGNAGHIAIEQVEPLASSHMIRSIPNKLFMVGGPVDLPLRGMPAWLPFCARLMRASTPARFAIGKAALATLLSEAIPAWRRLLADLKSPDLLAEDGHLIAWESEKTAAAGLAKWQIADIGTARLTEVDPRMLKTLQEAVSPRIAAAVRFNGPGQITDLDALGKTLHSRVSALGGQIVPGRAISISGSCGAHVRLEDGRLLTADLLLVAAGAASDRLLASLGMRVPLIAERGYHIESASTLWPNLPPVVFEDRSVIVTRFAHGLRFAGFVEFASAGFRPDRRKWDRLRAHADALGIGLDQHITRWMGARPTLPDYLPAIGRLEDRPSVAYAFGHQHLGLTLAAITGELVGDLAEGGPLMQRTADILAPFSLARFR